jgi:hypothetical protein
MRPIVRHGERGSGTGAIPRMESAGAGGRHCPAALDSRNGKFELASLLPGGQTHSAGSELKGSGNTSSPEPVLGYGATKGMEAYYQEVIGFGTLAFGLSKRT